MDNYHLAIWLLLLAAPVWGYGQSQNFEDGFEDGDFTAKPSWSGDDGQYAVIDGQHNKLLQLQGDDVNGGVSYLSTSSTDSIGSWEFFVRLDFSPSGGNKTEIFLMSDIANLEGPLNGYALRAGESGSADVFRIVRYDAGTEGATVLSGTTDISEGGAFRVKVSRQSRGVWTLEVAQGYGGVLSQEGNAQTDTTYNSTSYFGVRSTYTSSRADLFYYDFKIDLPPLTITDATARNDSIEVTFNRPFDQSTVQRADFSVDNSLGSPSSINFTSSTTVTLIYGDTLKSDQYILEAENIQGLQGNNIDENTLISFVVFGTAAANDIVLNEFMYDPPSGQVEYIELKNTSAKYLNLQYWQLGDDSNSQALSTDTLAIAPNNFLVVSRDTTALSSIFGNIPYVQADLPSLNNTGDAVRLLSNNGLPADSLYYTPNWGGTGVALERRSATVSETYRENWGDSPAPNGGTPGANNQVVEDTQPPELRDLNILSDLKLQLLFDERLDSSAMDPSHYDIDGIGISTVTVTAPDTIHLMLDAYLQNATEYPLTISGISDIFGNTSLSRDTSFTYYKISPVDSSDVFINEFMSDPPTGQSEYIELYNPTQRTFDLEQWSVNDNTGNRVPISYEKHLLTPESFVVLATDSTLTQLDPGIPVINMGNRLPALNNSGDDIVLRDSSGLVLDSLRYTDTWGEPGKALERRSLDLSATFEANWGNPSDTTGSPGYSNVLAPDTAPPDLQSFDITGNQSLRLIFDEQITSPFQSGEFEISGPTSITSKQFYSPDTVRLALSEPLQDASTYEVSITNITDLFDNKTLAIDTLFTYYEPSEADSGQIFINEFSYNPAPGNTEYIEIYNPTNHSFDLKGWTLSDNRSNQNIITETSTILPPNSYVVLAPDNTLLETHSDISLIAIGSGFPALNNSGDDIVLHDKSGTRLDSLRFTSAWGGDEIPLERRTTNIAGIFKENWGPAPNSSGSAGKQNNIDKDQEPPKLLSLSIESASELQLVFSERLTSASATKQSNFELSPARSIRLISMHDDSVRLFLDKPLLSERQYTLTFSDISDIFGNKNPETQHNIEYLKIEKARAGDIVINEIMADPGPQSAEFVELYNPTNKNIDLSGWSFGDASGRTSLPSNQLLKAGQYLILTGSSTFAQTHNNVVLLPGFPTLNNTTEILALYNASNHSIDSLNYNATWPTMENHTSLERKDPQSASNDPSNWTTNTTKQGSSAGAKNHHYQEDKTPPKALFAKIRADQKIEVYFSEFIQNTKNLQFSMEDKPLNKQTFDSSSGNRIILDNTGITSESQIIIVQNVIDIRGNETPKTEIPLARPLAKGDLVVNEIMYHPMDKSDDNKPDQTEYVELYNTREYALSLEGLIMHDAPDEDGTVRELHPVSTTTKWVQPNQTVLIYPDQASTFSKSKLASFFELDSLATQSLLHIERSGLSLAATGDAVYIADSTGMTIDSVYYSETWHNPNLMDHQGRALERITPSGKSNSPENWGSSVHPKGGTPHAQNSLYQVQPEQPKQTGISFTPNPFSPDGDGHEDNLVISYKLDQADYLLKVNIFDRYGRHIKELADGKPAGFEGSLIWDGRRDDGRRNRIGIYIIVFEAYDSSSGSDKAYKKTVVIARKLN